ncbi:MAG TPA: hypothetical protein VIH45_02350 [Desulfuromonadaceae bacterium]
MDEKVTCATPPAPRGCHRAHDSGDGTGQSALQELPEAAESGVIGAPDELLFEKVVAFINFRPGSKYTPELELRIRLHIANRLSSVAIPQEVVPVEVVPKNKSGKIMRRVLKARYLGQDSGDISTLEA